MNKISRPQSISVYGDPIWNEALWNEKYRNIIQSLQRKIALRVASAYCTTSTGALMVVISTQPIFLLAQEVCEITRKKEVSKNDTLSRTVAKTNAMTRWQAAWYTPKNGRLTYRLIPNIHNWVQGSFGEPSFHLSRFLTGHGCIHKNGYFTSPKCGRYSLVQNKLGYSLQFCRKSAGTDSETR